MQTSTSSSGWKRVSPTLDIEIQHGIPVHVYCKNTAQSYNNKQITSQVQTLTGLSVSIFDATNISTKAHEWTVCIDKNEFDEVLNRLAIASAAMYVDCFHKPIDNSAVDWNNAEFNYDFNHAVEHCCIAHGSINKENYYNHYINVMKQESKRLIDEGISPLVEAE